MPVIPVLAGMEVSGVVFLPERVTRFSEALGRHLEELRQSAVAAVGGKEFNLASPDQVRGNGGGGVLQRTGLGCGFGVVVLFLRFCIPRPDTPRWVVCCVDGVLQRCLPLYFFVQGGCIISLLQPEGIVKTACGFKGNLSNCCV